VFVADLHGRVDTAADAPVSGDWSAVDPFGAYWSVDLERPLRAFGQEPLRVRVSVSCGDVTEEASWFRAWSPPGTEETPWEGHRVAGRLIRPVHTAECPAVVVLPGSDGGLGSLGIARLLAGHGVAALPIGFWNLPGLPDAMVDIDVEVVAQAARHLRAQDGIPDHPVTVVGVSRGGELALLAGAHLREDVGSTVSVVGSGAPWGAFGEDVDINLPAWRLDGVAVAKLWEDPTAPNAVLDNPDALAAAAIPVERTRGRVLLLTGADDQLWPATQLSDIAVRRAHTNDADDRVEHISYPDAGHLTAVPPGVPVVHRAVHPVDGSVMDFGGTAVGNRTARRAAWRRLVTFIRAAPWS
jgi:dienelactone hydrolase